MIATKSRTSKTSKTSKVRLKAGLQWIRVDKLVFDEAVQPRDRVDATWVRDLAGFRKDGSEFPPIVVFQLSDGALLPGSGHHRVLAMQLAGEDRVLCDLRDGTREDAIVFAAASNKGNGPKPMGQKDLGKAITMLLAIDAWWTKGDTVIAGHVGCSPHMVNRRRSRLIAGGRPAPVFIEMRSGGVRFRKSATGVDPRRVHANSDGSGFKAKYKGKTVYGATPKAVQAKIADAQKSGQCRRLSLNPSALDGFLSRRGFCTVFGHASVTSFRGLHGWHRRGIVAIGCDFFGPDSLPAACGRLMLARQKSGDLSARLVILGYIEDGQPAVIELAKAAGFEFMTPDAMVASLA